MSDYINDNFDYDYDYDYDYDEQLEIARKARKEEERAQEKFERFIKRIEEGY